MACPARRGPVCEERPADAGALMERNQRRIRRGLRPDYPLHKLLKLAFGTRYASQTPFEFSENCGREKGPPVLASYTSWGRVGHHVTGRGRVVSARFDPWGRLPGRACAGFEPRA